MVPVHTHTAHDSPFSARPAEKSEYARLFREGEEIGMVSFPPPPRFYGLKTEDGTPYWKIAQLHARDVLATTVLQNCIRYPDRETRCQFLRHWRVTECRQNDRPKNPRAVGRSHRGGSTARRHRTCRDDDGDAPDLRPRGGHLMRKRPGDHASRADSDSRSVRAPRRFFLGSGA